MRTASLITLAAAVAFATTVPADAASKRHVKHPPHAQPAPGYRAEAAPRMYEVRPGYWVSTYGCYTDDGYGRIAGCGGQDSND